MSFASVVAITRNVARVKFHQKLRELQFAWHGVQNIVLPQFQAVPNLSLEGMDYEHTQSESAVDSAIWFAAPKSKISPGRKREKHGLYFPDKVNWARCEKCGEPKRPHRICTTHLEVCALSDDEYEAYVDKLEKEAGEAKDNEKKEIVA